MWDIAQLVEHVKNLSSLDSNSKSNSMIRTLLWVRVPLSRLDTYSKYIYKKYEISAVSINKMKGQRKMNDNLKLFNEFVGSKSGEKIPDIVKKSPPDSGFDFMNAVQQTLNEITHNAQRTENGALGYKSTGKYLLDLNFQVSSLRQKSEDQIYRMFVDAYYEDPVLAWKWLFYLRDVRGGMSERRSFRAIMRKMADDHPKEVAAVIPYIAEYGRYDGLFVLLDTPLKPIIIELIEAQLKADIIAYQENKSISLLAKWLPSRNASSRKTKDYADILVEELGLTYYVYQKTVSKLRKKLDIVETYMSENRWSEIDYNKIPSRANLIYRNAFLRHDFERRQAFLEALKRQDDGVKINAGTLFPHDIIHNYTDGDYTCKPLDETLEELWKALPDEVNGTKNVMVVADGSGSMSWARISNSNTTALDVANALAIYFSERASGLYKDKYITFSSKPQYVDFSNAQSLRDKLQIAARHTECSNTNIEAVFDLILNTALNSGLKQQDLPKTVLVISDMEFDGHVTGNQNAGACYGRIKAADKTLFQNIADKYKRKGYTLPRLAFWNVCSRTGTIPVKENEMGVSLVSGFSTAVINMVLSGDLDPYSALVKALESDRYKIIGEVIEKVRLEAV